jgi:hypothetical protein
VSINDIGKKWNVCTPRGFLGKNASANVKSFPPVRNRDEDMQRLERLKETLKVRPHTFSPFPYSNWRLRGLNYSSLPRLGIRVQKLSSTHASNTYPRLSPWHLQISEAREPNIHR